jgi:phage terminase large subunit-like protein
MSGGFRPLMIRLSGASPEEVRRIITEMDWRDILKLDAAFESFAHEGQLPPSGDGWRTWLLMAGRGFGKTRAGAEWIDAMARSRPGVRIALVGASIGEARGVMVEGVSGLLAVARHKRKRVTWEPSLGRLRWPNGSEAHLFSGDHADGLRGPEHDFAWCDELAKWGQAEDAWMNLQMGLRRGSRPRVLVTTTPKGGVRLLETIRDQKWTVTTGGRTADNVNLDPKFVDVMTATYGGTRMGRQELDGELIGEAEGALWTRGLIDGARVLPILPGTGRWRAEGVTEGGRGCSALAVGPLHHPADGPPPGSGEDYDRIYVGVDPPGGAGPECDACGIVVVGRTGDCLDVLADETVQGLSPDGWASCVAATVARWKAGLVVAEGNIGGALVEQVLKVADSSLRVRIVHARHGKSARAEPVALRFEKGRARLAGHFPELEEQMMGMIAGGGYEGPGRSPDRADAMVWAMTALGESRSGVPRVRRL